ncbi:MAG TPA: NlpC/P60 family protein [Verrucomicrobiae bacterium]|jgi:hypothetical protein|nr:NlpC/P60 family protein [Verrucomicrobiae bacterium]
MRLSSAKFAYKNILLLLVVFVCALSYGQPLAFADTCQSSSSSPPSLIGSSPTTTDTCLSQSELQALTEYPNWVGTGTCSSDSSATTSGPTGSGSTNSGSGTFTIDQVKTFLSEADNSTWNISNSTVEQWFLKTNSPVIAKYGLNSSNIGQITSAVQAANISPVFFYLDTVNEGGGAGGFINHYGSDTSGGGPGNATRDAQYIASESKTTQDGPAVGGGEPGDMPTAEAQSILASLPTGSIGVYYIQATSAVTAELEELSGKTGDWDGNITNYGHPVSDMMQNIQQMGGDPLQGGSTVSSSDCSGSVAGQGIAKAVSWAVMIANNNGYGYDQATRTSGWAKWQSDPSCTHACGSFDCSSFVAAALTEAGYFQTNPEFATPTEGAALTGVGFKDITSSVNLTTGAGMESGDILVNTADHTAIYIGNNQMVAARINELGTVDGGQVGDQTGQEIETEAYSNYPWTNVYRATN